MSNRLDKWRAGLFSAYPNFSSPYWRALPLGRMKKLLMGVFFTTAGVGFALDLFQIDHPPLARGLFWPVFCGAMAVSLFTARIKRPRLALVVWVLMVVLAGIDFQNCEYLGELAPRRVEPSRWVRRPRDLAGCGGWFQIPAVVCDDRGPG
jgi:hypothetical protein